MEGGATDVPAMAHSMRERGRTEVVSLGRLGRGLWMVKDSKEWEHTGITFYNPGIGFVKPQVDEETAWGGEHDCGGWLARFVGEPADGLADGDVA